MAKISFGSAPALGRSRSIENSSRVNAANAYRDDLKCPEKSYKQQITWTTSQLADDKIEASGVDLRNRNTMVVGFLLRSLPGNA
jgi:hypothetical protein